MAALLLKSNNAETGTNGASVTAANSGGATANNIFTVTGTWTYSNTPVLQSGLNFATTGGVSALRWISLGATPKWKVRCWWQTSSIAVTSDIIKVTYDLAGTTWTKFEFSNSANRFRVKNNAATLGTSTIIPQINTTYIFEFVGDNTANTITAYMYNSSGTLLDTMSYTAVACPQMVYVDFGPNVASGTAAYFDGLEVWDNETYTYTAPADGNSLRVSVGANGTDYPKINSAPATSVLIGMWSKPYAVPASPLKSGNHEIICVGGNYWEMQQITDNIAGNTHTDGNIDSFNQNSQFFASKTSGGTLNWANDYTVYYNPGLITQSLYLDWKYSMWQIILDSPGNQFIFRQWIKWGLTGAVEKTGESIVSFATVRAALQANAGWTLAEANAWTPDNLNHIYLGDSGAGGTIWDYIRNCKVIDRATEPSLAEVNGYATNFAADLTAWADWELKWTGGYPILTDRSGNNRTMYDAGTIRQGDVFTGGSGGGSTMAIQNFSRILNTRAVEFSQTVDTTATGQKDYVLLPTDALGFSASWRGLSTASVKLQATNSTQAEVLAGTAIWYDIGSASTGGTVQAYQNAVVPTAVTFYVTTGLAGNQGYWSIRCNSNAPF